jgi:hypothetical protein
MTPGLPFESLNATRSSPRMRTRTGLQSAPGSSSESSAGSQYLRNSSPIGVPRSVLVISSLSLTLSTESAPLFSRKRSPAIPHVIASRRLRHDLGCRSRERLDGRPRMSVGTCSGYPPILARACRIPARSLGSDGQVVHLANCIAANQPLAPANTQPISLTLRREASWRQDYPQTCPFMVMRSRMIRGNAQD